MLFQQEDKVSLQHYTIRLQNSANIEKSNTVTTFCLSFDWLPNNFHTKKFSIKHEKAHTTGKKRNNTANPTQFATSPGSSPRTSCGSRHFHNNSNDAKVTGDFEKNAEEKSQVITNNLLVAFNVCTAAIFTLFTGNSQILKTWLKILLETVIPPKHPVSPRDCWLHTGMLLVFLFHKRQF